MSKKLTHPELERRFLPLDDLEVREEGEGPKIVGYASVFNQLSLPLPFGREKVKRGAWAETIRNDDIRALWNHDSNIVLGRNKAGTLTLEEDRKGLRAEITPPASFQFLESIKRGDVSGMSLSFQVQEQKWENMDSEEETIRTILKAKLFEVSPVTFPAFPDTTAAVRAMDEWKSGFWRQELAMRRRHLRLLEIELF